MARRQFGVFLLLSVIVPLLVSTIILIVVVMVLPNSELQTETEGQNTQLTGNKSKQQVSPQSYETKSRVVFILGITFASGLFVFLIVFIGVVCTWVRQAGRYAVGDQNCEVTQQVDTGGHCQLTKHSENNKTKKSIIAKKNEVGSITLAALPSLPVKTVAVTTQVTTKYLEEKGVDNNSLTFDIHELEKHPEVRSKNYGTLGRTHLLSTADEDGYHIDNFGFDSEEANTEEFSSSLGKRPSSFNAFQHNFPDVINQSVSTIQPSTTEGQGAKVTSVTEVDSSDQNNPSQKQLSKQDSFQGLPPLRSFDRYLTLVRLDSDTSLESYSMEETRRIWKSIDEEDEKEELKEETDNK